LSSCEDTGAGTPIQSNCPYEIKTTSAAREQGTATLPSTASPVIPEVVGYYETSGMKKMLSRLAAKPNAGKVRSVAQESLMKFERKLRYFEDSRFTSPEQSLT
jgi:hypothetical protein